MKWLVMILCFGLSSTTLAEEGNRPWWKVWEGIDQATRGDSRLFSDREKRVLNAYLLTVAGDTDRQQRGKHATGKGHDKKKALPPGLQKNWLVAEVCHPVGKRR